MLLVSLVRLVPPPNQPLHFPLDGKWPNPLDCQRGPQRHLRVWRLHRLAVILIYIPLTSQTYQASLSAGNTFYRIAMAAGQYYLRDHCT